MYNIQNMCVAIILLCVFLSEDTFIYKYNLLHTYINVSHTYINYYLSHTNLTFIKISDFVRSSSIINVQKYECCLQYALTSFLSSLICCILIIIFFLGLYKFYMNNMRFPTRILNCTNIFYTFKHIKHQLCKYDLNSYIFYIYDRICL